MPKKHDFTQEESTAICRVIDALLEVRGEKWAWLSRQTGYSHNHFSNFRNSKRIISKTSLEKIAEALEKPVAYFTQSINHGHTDFLTRGLIKTHELPFDIQEIKNYRELSEAALDWGILTKTDEIDNSIPPVHAWRNKDLYAFESDNCIYVKNYDGRFLVVSGPTRTGKTLTILEFLFWIGFQVPKMRILIVRAKAVDLSDTIRPSIKDDLLEHRFSDPLSPLSARGGDEAFSNIYFPNGTEMILIGADRERKLLGGRYDIVFYSQVEQATQEQIQILLTRTVATGAWKYPDGMPRSLVICDDNPYRMDDPIYEAHQNGEDIDWITFDFEDNPFFFRKGQKTQNYSEVDRLDNNLVGVYHDRYFKGIRKSPTGAVFELQDCHKITELPWNESAIDDWLFFRAMDFGMSSPSTTIWIAEHKETQEVVVFREWGQTKTDVMLMAEQILPLSPEEIEITIIDNNENNHDILEREFDIDCEMTVKNDKSIMTGVYCIQKGLRQTVINHNAGLENNPGGLRIYEDVHGVETNPDVHVMTLWEELSKKVFAENTKKDTLEDGDDHKIDPLRYYYLYRLKDMPFDLPAVLGSFDIYG